MIFEPTIPVFERVKTVHALHRAANAADFRVEYLSGTSFLFRHHGHIAFDVPTGLLPIE
jgi:hypothetical protein